MIKSQIFRILILAAVAFSAGRPTNSVAGSSHQPALTAVGSAIRTPATTTTEAHTRTYTVIVDLDWTLLYGIKDPSTVNPKDLITYNGPEGPEYYRVSDYGAEFINALLRLDGVQVVFFSGGSKERNEAVLRHIDLGNGKTAIDAAAYVFSKDHLTQVSNDENLRFAQRFKKIVDHLIPGFDVDRAVLIDDQPDFAARALRAMLSHGRLTFHERFDESKAGQKYEPATSLEWMRERAKFAFHYAVIEAAYLMDRAGQAVFADFAQQTMKDRSTGGWLPIVDPKLDGLFHRGLEEVAGPGVARRFSCTTVFSR